MCSSSNLNKFISSKLHLRMSLIKVKPNSLSIFQVEYKITKKILQIFLQALKKHQPPLKYKKIM